MESELGNVSGTGIRPGEPTEADSAHFAALCDMAADGLFAALLGSRSGEIIARIYRRRGSALDYEHTRFLVVDGEVAGMVNGYPGREHRALNRRINWIWMRYAGWRVVRSAVVALPLRRVLAFMNRVDSDDFYVQLLAVYEAFRGRGLSRLLIEVAQSEARALGAVRLALDVDIANAAAITVYERFGFETVAVSEEASRLGDRVRVQRMVLSCEP